MVEVLLNNGQKIEAHTNNSGSMRSCSGPGRPVLVTRVTGEGSRLKYRLRAVGVESGWAGVDTSMPAAVVRSVLDAGGMGPLLGYRFVKREVVVNPGSRLDLELQSPDGKRVYGEIKNVTLWDGSGHHFPDARSERAATSAKHVRELTELVEQGTEAWGIFVVQRPEVGPVRPADTIDPEFGRVLRRAMGVGVKFVGLQCQVLAEGVRAVGVLPVECGTV